MHTWPLVLVCEFECVRGTDVVVVCAIREGAEALDDKFYRDLIMNFIIAGRDTTANALSWCIYTITTHPAVETKVRPLPPRVYVRACFCVLMVLAC